MADTKQEYDHEASPDENDEERCDTCGKPIVGAYLHEGDELTYEPVWMHEDEEW